MLRKNVVILSILAVIKLIVQLLGNRNYGYHRDELLHLSVSEHLDWGYMEFPPFIAWVGRLSYYFFDYSLMGTRIFPTLAGVGILVLCGLMAKELKGDKNAVFLAGVCVLAFLPFYRNHTLFQPVAFDQFFWTLGFYYIIRFINTENKNYLLLTALTLGVGLLNKYTILIWAFGVFIGMIFHHKGRVFKNRWWYISGLLALAIFIPNIIWQFDNNLPILRHLAALNEGHLDQASPMKFGLDQLNYPLTLIVSILGINFLFRRREFRAIGISALIIFFTMWLLQSKSYYIFALYPVLFAAGSVWISQKLKHRSVLWTYAPFSGVDDSSHS